MELPRISHNTPNWLKPHIKYAINEGIDKDYIKKYRIQFLNSKNRGIEFNLTFEEWYNWWKIDNRISNRGRKHGQFVMARFNDIGPYSLDNIYCATTAQNAMDMPKQYKELRSKKISRKKKMKVDMGIDVYSHLRRELHPKSRKIITPNGVFINATAAAEAHHISREGARRRAVKNLYGWRYED